MDLISISAIIGGVLVPIISLIYAMTRNIKKDHKVEFDNIKRDYKTEFDKISLRTGIMEKEIAKHDESFKRVHYRTDQIEHSHDKLETSVENKMDKFSEKLDKLFELILNQKKP
jgi:hypothetical protein